MSVGRKYPDKEKKGCKIEEKKERDTVDIVNYYMK